MSEKPDAERQLDALLASYRVAEPDTALTGAILASGTRHVAKRRRLRQWLMGAGLIGLGLAGGLTGAVAVAIITPREPMMQAELETAFGSVQVDSDAGKFQEEQ